MSEYHRIVNIENISTIVSNRNQTSSPIVIHDSQSIN